MLKDLRVTTGKVALHAAGETVSALGELHVNEDKYAEIAAPVAARVMRLGLEESFEANVNHVYLQLLPLMRSADFREGLQAFTERREPVFSGR